MAISLTTPARNALLDALATYIGSGARLRIYSGTRPTNANTALGAQVLLAELVCGTPFAPSAASAALTANAITQDASADATGTASFFRLFLANGTTAVTDGDCGVGTGELQLVSTSIVATQPVQVTSFVFNAGNP